MKTNLLEIIREQVLTDDGADQKQSDRLEQVYNEGTEKDKFIINEVLMCLCGWCFETIKTNNWKK